MPKFNEFKARPENEKECNYKPHVYALILKTMIEIQAEFVKGLSDCDLAKHRKYVFGLYFYLCL